MTSYKVQTPSVPISWGELIDKLTILEIKSKKICDQKALENINNEIGLINKVLIVLDNNLELNQLKLSLINTNSTLWEIEDRIREKEHLKQFDDEFIGLARSVYMQNDKRAEIKRCINLLLRSELIEEKSYQKYT